MRGGRDRWNLPGEKTGAEHKRVPATRFAAVAGSLDFTLTHGMLRMNTELNLGKFTVWSVLASFLQLAVRHGIAELLFWPLNWARGNLHHIRLCSPFLLLAEVTFVPGLWECIFSVMDGGRKCQAKFGTVPLAGTAISSHWEPSVRTVLLFREILQSSCTPS